MLARCLSASLLGIDARPVTVEVDLVPGLPGLQLVGLPDTAIQESRERVRSALQFGDVAGVQARNLRRDAKGAVVELLSIAFEAAEEAPAGVVTLTFAGGGDMRVTVDCLDVALADVSDPWTTPRTPGHD